MSMRMVSPYRGGMCVVFLIVGVVVAELQVPQEETYHDKVEIVSISGQESTQDTQESTEETGLVVFTNPEQKLITGEGVLLEKSSLLTTPSIKISEVFFDGNDEWIELVNDGEQPFSGSIMFSGVGIQGSITGYWESQEVSVVGRLGRTYPAIIDVSQMKYWINIGLTDTKAIGIQLWYQNQMIDNFVVETGVVIAYNDKNTSLERNIAEGSITGTSLERSKNVISTHRANPGYYLAWYTQTGDVQTGNVVQGFSSWMISEVYTDPDMWIELTNKGNSPYSGIVTVSGFSLESIHLPVYLLSGQSKIYAQQGSQILDTSTIALSGIGWYHQPNKKLHIQAYDNIGGQDEFVVDERYMKKYKDYNLSFEKVGEGNNWITTKTTIDRRYNYRPGFVVNPGKVSLTGQNLEKVDYPPITFTGQFPNPPIDCLSLSSNSMVHISEIFFGNAVYDSFIEIEVEEDINLKKIVLSGSLLQEEIQRINDNEEYVGEKNTIRLISSGQKRYDMGLDVVDNPKLSIKNTTGWLALFVMSGQTRQLMDIVYSVGENTGKSLYYRGVTQVCGRIFDDVGEFSPGFQKKFLEFFAVDTSPKIEYIIVGNAVAGSCPVLQSGSGANIQTASGANMFFPMTGEEEKDNTPMVTILGVEYDPEGSDTNRETITVLLNSGTQEHREGFLSKQRYLKIGSNKRYLSGDVQLQVKHTFTGSFGFPNTSKSGEVEIQLRYKNQKITEYVYSPRQILQESKPKQELTGSIVLKEVVDGDTLKILYEGKEQSVRLLGIDAPEISLLRNKKKGCLANEARGYLSTLVQGKVISMSFDPTQSKTDSYKRWLTYISVGETLVNEAMLQAGYAKEYTFKVPYQKRDVFLQAQQDAQSEKRGLWDPEVCPENNIITGEVKMSGENLPLDIQGSLLAVLPNPRGKDTQESVRLLLSTLSTEHREASGLFLGIKGAKKKLPPIIIGQEIELTGKFTLPNRAVCIDLGYQEKILDTLCYPKPKEGKWYTSQGQEETKISQEERDLLNSITLSKQENRLCVKYKDLEIGCRIIPSGKIADKTKQEHALYKKFITLLDGYLQKARKELYYAPDLQTYISLFRGAKQRIAKGEYQITTLRTPVATKDIDQQLLLMQTYSPVYRAKVFAQIGMTYGVEK